MRVYFVRHAEALEGTNDALRPLSKYGRQQSKAIGQFIAGVGVTFDAAFSSPLVRARETAQIILPITNKEAPLELEFSDMLLNETGSVEFLKWLAGFKSANHVLLVGHNPSMTENLARLLVAKNAYALRMAKGAVACVKWEGSDLPTLKFFITPKLLLAKRDEDED
jgi:phosphohistidine phosphatase